MRRRRREPSVQRGGAFLPGQAKLEPYAVLHAGLDAPALGHLLHEVQPPAVAGILSVRASARLEAQPVVANLDPNAVWIQPDPHVGPAPGAAPGRVPHYVRHEL